MVIDTPVLPFRVIAIAGSTTRIDRIHSITASFPRLRVGLILRDPDHNRASTRLLVEHARLRRWGDAVTLISNSFHFDGLAWIHRPASQLYRPISGEGEAIGIRSDVSGETLSHGYSVHSKAEATLAVSLGARYVMLSPIFPTGSKPRALPLGITAVADVAYTLPVPLFVLGGIVPENIAACRDAGAYGIASISLFAPEYHSAMLRTLQLSDLQ